MVFILEIYIKKAKLAKLRCKVDSLPVPLIQTREISNKQSKKSDSNYTLLEPE